MCTPESIVMAPFPGTILRRSFPYANNNEPYNNGLYLEGTGEAKGKISFPYIINQQKFKANRKQGLQQEHSPLRPELYRI